MPNTLSDKYSSSCSTLSSLFAAPSFRSFVSKLCTSMQFAACGVLLLQLVAEQTMEENSCEAKGSFWKDIGLMTYLTFFIFCFFLIHCLSFNSYDNEGKAIGKCRSLLPNIKQAIIFESKATDTINSCSSIYNWTISGVPAQGELAVKTILYTLMLLSPAFDTLFYFGKKTCFKQRLIAATQNPKFKKYFISLAEACYAGINLASTISMIIQFSINIAYDSVHEEDYPHSAWLLGIFSTLAGIIGFSIALSNSDTLNTILNKLQSSADSFYYPVANLLSMTECKWPNDFSVAGFQQDGYKIAIGASSIALVTAILDYCTHQPPNNEQEIFKVVERFSAKKTLSLNVKAALINMLCFGYLQKDEGSLPIKDTSAKSSEKTALLAKSPSERSIAINDGSREYDDLTQLQYSLNSTQFG